MINCDFHFMVLCLTHHTQDSHDFLLLNLKFKSVRAYWGFMMITFLRSWDYTLQRKSLPRASCQNSVLM